MRFRCTAKVERRSLDPKRADEVFYVRGGCLPLHETGTADSFRSMHVVLAPKRKNPKWSGLERGAQHERIESFVRAYLRQRGAAWVNSWQPGAIERIDLDEHPCDLAHDDPGEPFEVALA